MPTLYTLRIALLTLGLLMPAFALLAQEPAPPQANAKQETAKEVQEENGPKGMPPRAAPSEYQAQAKAGKVTIGAEFMGHSVPTPDHTYETEDYVIIEAGFFGPPGAHLTLSRDDFSLRINGKKGAVSNEPVELVLHSLKDPLWQPPHQQDSKQKAGGLTTGNGQDSLPPVPPKMPFELRRAMNLDVRHSVMEEGDRALPQAGLLFFLYHGKREGIRSLELIYSGAAGKATLELAP